MNSIVRRCLSRTIIQKAKQASPIIQNQLAHETYTTFAVDEQFVLHLEQERLRKENNQLNHGSTEWPQPTGLNQNDRLIYNTTVAKLKLENN